MAGLKPRGMFPLVMAIRHRLFEQDRFHLFVNPRPTPNSAAWCHWESYGKLTYSTLSKDGELLPARIADREFLAARLPHLRLARLWGCLGGGLRRFTLTLIAALGCKPNRLEIASRPGRTLVVDASGSMNWWLNRDDPSRVHRFTPNHSEDRVSVVVFNDRATPDWKRLTSTTRPVAGGHRRCQPRPHQCGRRSAQSLHTGLP